jgi:hypothetical protein
VPWNRHEADPSAFLENAGAQSAAVPLPSELSLNLAPFNHEIVLKD